MVAGTGFAACFVYMRGVVAKRCCQLLQVSDVQYLWNYENFHYLDLSQQAYFCFPGSLSFSTNCQLYVTDYKKPVYYVDEREPVKQVKVISKPKPAPKPKTKLQVIAACNANI